MAVKRLIFKLTTDRQTQTLGLVELHLHNKKPTVRSAAHIRRSTLDYDLVSHRIFSRNKGLFLGEDVMILYIHILIHLIA